MSNEPTPLLEVKNLTKHFPAAHGQKVHAVNGVSFKLERGETLGIVGESGCGKSSMGRTILKVHEPTSGQIIFDGVDITGLSNRKMFPYRKKMQMIFQDPYASLNPRQRVADIIMEPLLFHGIAKTKEEARERCMSILARVGLRPEQAGRYPHQFSGGQRQRICIARALALNPEFVVCDEAVSALDVSVRAQVLNLMRNMQQKKNLTYLFISHDLSVVRHISDRIAVMYLGSVVEVAEKAQLYSNPMHPYTKALLSAIPLPDVKKKRQRIILEGDVPSAYNPPSGCKFHTRCPYATDRCRQEAPVLQEVEKGHKAACHRALELA